MYDSSNATKYILQWQNDPQFCIERVQTSFPLVGGG